MPEHLEHLLERFVHHVLAEDTAPTRQLVRQALDQGGDAESLVADILWPAAECIGQLYEDGLVSTRIYNKATRALFGVAGTLVLPHAEMTAATDRRLFILSAPGEGSDLGAHLLTLLAESHGYTAMFAGAHLSMEEMVFSISRLQPDAVVIQGSLRSSLDEVNEVLERMREARFWPRVQMAVAGAVVGGAQGGACRADLMSRHPVELLELLALSADYRGSGTVQHGSGLQMPIDATPMLDEASMKASVLRHFPGRMNWN